MPVSSRSHLSRPDQTQQPTTPTTGGADPGVRRGGGLCPPVRPSAPSRPSRRRHKHAPQQQRKQRQQREQRGLVAVDQEDGWWGRGWRGCRGDCAPGWQGGGRQQGGGEAAAGRRGQRLHAQVCVCSISLCACWHWWGDPPIQDPTQPDPRAPAPPHPTHSPVQTSLSPTLLATLLPFFHICPRGGLGRHPPPLTTAELEGGGEEAAARGGEGGKGKRKGAGTGKGGGKRTRDIF